MKQETDSNPYVPLRLHLNSRRTIDLPHRSMGWVQRNAMLVLHCLGSVAQMIGNYDVIALQLIGRVEQLPEAANA